MAKKIPSKHVISESLLEKEVYHLKGSRGGGTLSYEVWGYVQNGKTIVTRYNLAYINFLLYQGDNARVLGFDNAHGYHHRHYMGEIEPIDFVSYEDVLERFQKEVMSLTSNMKKRKRK